MGGQRDARMQAGGIAWWGEGRKRVFLGTGGEQEVGLGPSPYAIFKPWVALLFTTSCSGSYLSRPVGAAAVLPWVKGKVFLCPLLVQQPPHFYAGCSTARLTA